MARDGRYVTIAQFLAAFDAELLKELTDGDPTKNPSEWVIDQDKIAAAIAMAEGSADRYISKRYKTPLSLENITDEAACDIVKQAVLDLALYRLYAKKGYASNTEAKALYAGAADALKGISEGSTELPGAETQSRKRTLYSAPRRRFGNHHCITNADD